MKTQFRSHLRFAALIAALVICGEILSLSQWRTPGVLAAPPGWATFADNVYGYKVDYPASWYVYPADGSVGSVTTISSADRSSLSSSDAALRIEISVAIFDRDPNVSLRDWIIVPADLAPYMSVSTSAPSTFTDARVIQSYAAPEGTFRRAYIARGQKVYIMDLLPDDPTQYALFSSVLESLAFSDTYLRTQPSRPKLFGESYQIFLPMVVKSGASSAPSSPRTSAPQVVPSNYRLPFVGGYEITQGPYYNVSGLTCVFSHKKFSNNWDDREAIDFALPNNTPLYASEAGVFHEYQLGSYGNVVMIKHDDQRVSWYAHLSSFENNTDGKRILRESPIGKSGNSRYCDTGACSWPYHLHFMVMSSQDPNNPYIHTTEYIRTLPKISWYSGSADIPCNDGRYGNRWLDGSNRFYDGYATGDPLGSATLCQAPQLVSPSDGASLSSPSATFTWSSVQCASNGYRLRIKTAPDMDGGGETVQDISLGSTQWSGTIAGEQWLGRDLYWSVKASDVANAAWAPAHRFRTTSTPPSSCSAPSLNSPSDGASFTSATVAFGWSDVSCPHAGFIFRIKTVPTMDSGGDTVADSFNGTTQRLESIPSNRFNQDLYWSVKAANVSSAAWATAHRFRITPTVTVPRPTLSSPTNGASLTQSTDVTLSWNASSGAAQYKVDLWGGPYSLMTLCDWQSATSCHVGQMWPGSMSWHVRARNSSGQESDWSDTWSLTVQQTIPSVGVPPLSSPSNGASMPQSTDVTLAWNAAANATQYTVEVWGGPYSNMTVCGWQAATTCHIGQMWPGTMSWHVKARGSSGQESAWSPTWSFTIQQASTAVKPTLSSPSNGAGLAQSTDVTLVWNSSSGASQYKVELWGGPYSLMVPCNWQSSTSCHIGQMWPGTMSWHVKAMNSSGQESDWSDTWSFVIQQGSSAPAAPALSSPGNGSSMAQSTDVTLVWNTSSSATQYKVELWGGPYSLMVPCDWQSGTSCHIGQMWPGTMSWHVKARNSSAQESAWSGTWTFTIQQIPSGPSTPSLSSPGNGSSMPQSTDVSLVWNTSSGASQYKVELWGGPYSLMTPCDWQSGTSCHIGQMWPGTMSWHAKARNSSGTESDWSGTWSFTIQQTQAPSAPGLSSPGNGSSMAQSTDVTLVWNTSSGASQYKVELWGGPYSLMTPCDWQSGTSCHIGQMWPGTMSWHAKARNSGGQESGWSDTWSFTIQQAPATWKPTLSSPSNGASLPRSTDVTLYWNTLSGATQYKVELWGGPYSLMTPCNWQSGTSCHIGGMWPGNMLWHVKARNSSGTESDWSDTWNFTIQN